MNVYKVRIRQGRLAVTARNPGHADAQASELEADIARDRRVRAQVQAGHRLFALGEQAWHYLKQEGLA